MKTYANAAELIAAIAPHQTNTSPNLPTSPKPTNTAAEGCKWNDLGRLYRQFYRQYGGLTLHEAQAELRGQVARICAWLETLSEQELFAPGQRKWADNQAKWPIWKWVHINTVAPFTHFRTLIRKWKKAA